METFNELLTKWQPFFSTVASVAATLAGLLFVSLSINREKITAEKNGILWRAAHRSFGDFLYTLFLALMFLIPAHNAYTLCIPLTSVVIVRAFLFLRGTFRSRRDQRAARAGVTTEWIMQTIPILGLLAADVEIFRGNISAVFFLVPVIAFLLYTASVNAWSLLLIENGAAASGR